MMATFAKDEVLQAKRAVVVLQEIAKAVPELIKSKQAPSEMRADLLALIKIVRKAEEVAT
mgnify:CR=1 FL=1